MRSTPKLAITFVVGIAVGAGAMNALQAQITKKAAYLIADLEITDQPAFQAYAAKVPDSLRPYNGRIIARGKPILKEGTAPPGIIAVLAFDSVADAEKWWISPEYVPLIPERQKASKGSIFIVEGLPQ